ncbi:MmpS family transport accessory protein [Streptomyces smyrnaeus]|uniref:MmpS family transport accessory protein n=1 Tax=Streptomyces smyrnaeus TaxID=1387713 RepID=UPI0033B4BA88
MRIHKAAACLFAATTLLLAGCSDDDGGGRKKSARGGGDAKVNADDGTVTVEIKVTGDSPANVYVPGILGKGVDKKDLDIDGIKTPWSKKFTLESGRMVNMQASSSDPKSEIGCQVLVDGKVVKEKVTKAKPGSTLVSYCYTTV